MTGAVVLALVCLAVSGSTLFSVSSADMSREKTWVIRISQGSQGKTHRNDDGFIEGFNVDITNAVCEAAGIQCRLVVLPATWCWDTAEGQQPRGGKALMAGWIDACVGMRPTVDRIKVFDFSRELLRNTGTLASFVIKTGNSLEKENIKNKRIAFQRGYTTDDKCMARGGYILPQEQIFSCGTADDCFTMLLNDEVDALFMSGTVVPEDRTDLTFLSDLQMVCGLGGNSLMARKGNEIIDHWNRGLQALLNNGQYKKLCDNVNTVHADRMRQPLPCLV